MARMASKQGRCVVGVISDTHGLIRLQALRRLKGADLIVHCGDVGSPAVLDALRSIAPVHAVRGNNDKGSWAARLPRDEVVKAAGQNLYVIHDLNELDLEPSAAGFAAVLSGHSHKPRIEHRGGVLFLNPGSAGPRRFTLPIAVARLVVKGGGCEGQIIELNLNSPKPRRISANPQLRRVEVNALYDCQQGKRGGVRAAGVHLSVHRLARLGRL